MNLLQLLPTILRTVGKLTGIGIFTSAASTLDQTALTPEQQTALQAALLEHQQAMAAIDLEALKTVMAESIAEIQSTDTYTKRARPTALYAATFITMGLAGAMMVGRTLDTGALTALLLPLWSAGGYYIYSRTKEKLAGQS